MKKTQGLKTTGTGDEEVPCLPSYCLKKNQNVHARKTKFKSHTNIMMDAVVHSGRSQSLRVDSQVSKENGDSTELKMPLHKANMCLLGIVVWEIG